MIRYLIDKMGDCVLESKSEALIAGEPVEKGINEELTYNEIYFSISTVWSLL